jgi:hypothetical protein
MDSKNIFRVKLATHLHHVPRLRISGAVPQPLHPMPLWYTMGFAFILVLGGPGIESRWGARFFTPEQTGPGAHPASQSFPGVKRSERGIDHPPHLAPGLKK